MQSNPATRAAIMLSALLALTALPAAAAPVFGPMSYEITDGTPYDDTFPSTGGRYVMWVQNGDDGGNQVEFATITLNGSVVADADDFSEDNELFAEKVDLLAGDNTLSVSMVGSSGSFITIIILPKGERPNVTIGRLLIPYSALESLQLDLKNGSHAGDRNVRVVFYDAAGTYAASSDRIVLAPKASLTEAASSFLVNGNTAWSEGSIEIFYVGRGRGRLFGETSQTDAATGVSSLTEIQHAGSRLLSPHDQGKKKRVFAESCG